MMQIGCDLVQVSRLERLSENQAFLDRVFHPDEITYCRSLAKPGASFAARFAAKEAFSKALGTGLFVEGVAPRDVWVTRTETGRPRLNLSPHIASLVHKGGWTNWDISLSHDGDMAMAVVVIS